MKYIWFSPQKSKCPLSICFITFLYIDLYVIVDYTSKSNESFMLTKHLSVSIHISDAGEVGSVKHFKLSSKFLTDRSNAVLLLWILFLLFVFRVILSCLFFASLLSPAGKGLTSWLSCL